MFIVQIYSRSSFLPNLDKPEPNRVFQSWIKIFPSAMLVNKALQKIVKNIMPKNTSI
jgi:hypothetical protein